MPVGIGKWVFVIAAALTVSVLGRAARADDWKTVDCATAPLSVDGAPPAKSCHRGPDIPSLRNGCFTNQFNVVWVIGDGLFFTHLARVEVGRCYLSPLDPRQLTKMVNAVNKDKMSSVGEPTSFLDGYVLEFRRGDDRCFGFIQHGPPSFSGYEYNIDGQFCTANSDGFDDAHKRTLIRSIKIGYFKPDLAKEKKNDATAGDGAN